MRCAQLEIENGKLREQLDEAVAEVLFLRGLNEELRALLQKQQAS